MIEIIVGFHFDVANLLLFKEMLNEVGNILGVKEDVFRQIIDR